MDGKHCGHIRSKAEEPVAFYSLFEFPINVGFACQVKECVYNSHSVFLFATPASFT